MAAARIMGSGAVLSRPVTFVTGNAKKLEEVRAILGQSIPFQSLKLDRNSQTLIHHFLLCPLFLHLILFYPIHQNQLKMRTDNSLFGRKSLVILRLI